MGGQSVGDPERWGWGGVNSGRKEPGARQSGEEPERRKRGGVNSERKEPGAWRSVEEAVAADEQGADPTPSPLGGNDGVEPAVGSCHGGVRNLPRRPFRLELEGSERQAPKEWQGWTGWAPQQTGEGRPSLTPAG